MKEFKVIESLREVSLRTMLQTRPDFGKRSESRKPFLLESDVVSGGRENQYAKANDFHAEGGNANRCYGGRY